MHTYTDIALSVSAKSNEEFNLSFILTISKLAKWFNNN